ncbi:MAG: tetratricopeptide repeat-containing sensor histidine kinase [Bacteroidota bacterium]|nr:tetratricopeptide repeat-containing sensor histidine kinase [Bacteroidota bacterium]
MFDINNNNRIRVLGTYWFLSISLLCLAINISAQNRQVDSLLNLIKKHQNQNTALVNLYCNLAENYRYFNPEKMEPMAMKGLKLAEKIGYKKGMGDCILALGVYCSFIGEHEKALRYDNIAIGKYKEINDKKGLGAAYNNIANIYSDQARYYESIGFYKKSLAIRELIADSEGIASSYNNMGNSWLNLGNYSEALTNLLKGLSIREKLGKSQPIVNSLNNLAGVYNTIGNPRKGLHYSLKAIKLSEKDSNILGCLWSYNTAALSYAGLKKYERSLYYYYKGLNLAIKNEFEGEARVYEIGIAEVYVFLKDYTRATEHYQKSLKMGENLNNPDEDATIYIGLGSIYAKSGDVKKGLEYLLKGYQLAERIHFRPPMLQVTNEIANAYALMNDYKKAFHYKQLNSAYADSLLNDETNKKIAEAQFDFELAKKQNAIELLEKDKSIQQKESDKQKYISMGLLGFLILSFIILLGVVVNIRKERKSTALIRKQKDEIEKQRVTLESLNQLKDKTFSILSHDLRSPVGSLTQILIMLEDQSITPEEFLILKKHLDQQLVALNRFLDNLLHWSKSHMEGNVSSLKVPLNLLDLVQHNFQLMHENAKQKQIEMINELSDDVIITADKDQIDLVLRNLIANAIKFTTKNGTIKVSSKEENNRLIIAVSDNGIGMSAERSANLFGDFANRSLDGTIGEKGTGLGLLLCKEFVELHQGTIWVESELKKGSTFFVSFPVREV